jgi:hypothetical protein
MDIAGVKWCFEADTTGVLTYDREGETYFLKFDDNGPDVGFRGSHAFRSASYSRAGYTGQYKTAFNPGIDITSTCRCKTL